jgi:hypothetical protein
MDPVMIVCLAVWIVSSVAAVVVIVKNGHDRGGK